VTLFRQFFGAQFKGLLIWVGVAALFALSGTRSGATFVEGDAMAKMPQALLSIYGDIGGLSAIDAYLTLILGKGTGLIPTLYAVILALSVVTREVDRRTVEFLLSLPVQRTQVLLSRLAVLILNVTALVGAMWAVLRYDLPAQGYEASWGSLGLIFLNLWMLSIAVGAVTLAVSMWIDDYSLGVKLFLGAVTLAYFMEYVLRAAHVSRAARVFSPFSYLEPTSIMRSGSIATGSIIVLVVTVAAGVAVSFWAFNRKQFSA